MWFKRKWFRRDPAVKLRADYLRLLEEARDLQRNGDIEGFAVTTDRAEQLAKQIDAIEDAKKPAGQDQR